MPKPPFAPSDEQRRQVEALAGFGVPLEGICALVVDPRTGKGIERKALRQLFAAELASGQAKAHARVAESLFQQAVGAPAEYDGDNRLVRAAQPRVVAAAVFWAKARMGWNERGGGEPAGNDDGSITHQHLRSLSDEDLDRLEAILRRSAGPAPSAAAAARPGNSARSGKPAGAGELGEPAEPEPDPDGEGAAGG